MALLPDIFSDPTLDAIDRLALEQAAAQPRRDYLGASAIGGECDRNLWYSLRPEIPRKPDDALSLRRFEDGHRTEALVIQRLRAVPGVQVWDRHADGGQIGGKLFAGRFGWHVDGVILGLLQAPRTSHVLEIKCTDELKDFVRLRDKLGEKQALQAWNPSYYAQAVIYMHLLDLDRHYTVVASPGGRRMASCRTEANHEMAKALLGKAERILGASEPPTRISQRPEFFKCCWCAYRKPCHGLETEPGEPAA